MRNLEIFLNLGKYFTQVSARCQTEENPSDNDYDKVC